eukprot:GHVU01135328.1.p1 GENE.GHVU01135328.1~~GHVU01135328.1.p1  ORF type:complete len:107 (+),score=3.25 GHVU01135328.1:985-1305(+)
MQTRTVIMVIIIIIIIIIAIIIASMNDELDESGEVVHPSKTNRRLLYCIAPHGHIRRRGQPHMHEHVSPSISSTLHLPSQASQPRPSRQSAFTFDFFLRESGVGDD